MAFTIEDVRDLAQLLKEHPEWRTELQRLLQTEEQAAMPETLRLLGDAQKRVEATLERVSQELARVIEIQRQNSEQIAQLIEAQRRTTDEQFAQLAEVQRRTEAQLAETQRQPEERLAATRQYVDEQFAQLAGAQRQAEAQMAQQAASHTQLTARVDQLTARVDDLTVRLEQLTAQVEQLTRSARVLQDQMGDVCGRLLEMEYCDKAHVFFGTLLRRVRIAESNDPIWDALEERLEEDEVQQVLRLDLLVRRRLRGAQDTAEVWLAVEVSTTLDERDITRAAQRAALLRKAGFRAVPVVAGLQLASDDASEAADREGVVVLLDGIVRG